MKQTKLILLILSLCLLCGSLYFGYRATSNSGTIIENSLTALYLFSLFVALLGLRISLIYSERVNWIILVLTIFSVILSTSMWVKPTLIPSLWSYSLSTLVLMLGLTINSHLNGKTVLAKIARICTSITTLLLILIFLIPLGAPFIFQCALVLLILSTLLSVLSIASERSS